MTVEQLVQERDAALDAVAALQAQLVYAQAALDAADAEVARNVHVAALTAEHGTFVVVGNEVYNARRVQALNDHLAALTAALTDAIETIRAFHGPECWEIYRDQAPEMQRYRAALDAAQAG